MNHPSFTASLMLLFLLSACNMYSPFDTAEPDPPPAFVAQEVFKALNEGKENEGFSVIWWEGFDDEIINSLVKKSLENNYQIARAAAQIKEAEGQLRLAGAGDNLTADAGVDGTIEERRDLENGSGTTTKQGLAALGAILPLDIFGRTRLNVESARAALDASKAVLRGQILTISSEIVREYLRLRGNQRQLELLYESVGLQEKTLAIVKSRFKSGLSPELDLRRAETSVENLRADIPPLKQALTNSYNRLAGLTGQYPGIYNALLKQQKQIPVYKSRIPEALPLDVLSKRPDIQEAEANLKEAITNIGVAKVAYYPAFQLSGQIRISTTGIQGMPTVDMLLSSLGLLIDQVVADGGARKANVDIAKARAEEALASYRLALRSASEEVETSLTSIQTSLKRQEYLENVVQSSTRSFSQAEALYQQGLINFLDVVDAQRVLASAEQRLAAERTNYAEQIAILFRTLGTTASSPEPT